jgi:hypothetical protein
MQYITFRMSRSYKCNQNMRLNVIAAFVLATLTLLVSSSVLVKAYAQSEPIKCQTNERLQLYVLTDGPSKNT